MAEIARGLLRGLERRILAHELIAERRREAALEKAPTTDRAWKSLAVGVEIETLR